jgi:hypothetical protein
LKESHKVSDYGLIYNKVRGLSAKCQEIGFSRNCFADEKTRGPSPQFMDHERLRFTMDRCHGQPRELSLQPLRGSGSPWKGRGRWRRWWRAHLWAHRSSGGGETAARWRGMADGGRCSVRWGLRTQERAKEGGGECGDGRGCSSPFYRGREVESGRGRQRNGRR